MDWQNIIVTLIFIWAAYATLRRIIKTFRGGAKSVVEGDGSAVGGDKSAVEGGISTVKKDCNGQGCQSCH